ncbi:MAG: hypothetical protein LBJ65_15025 [Burkholderia sp.]|jgi:hypothetical protein|uniref:hypothetical protein n=1 Tax=Burkholderia sp. TaxID=36773 RepID=UPI0028239116|nr:hypothetical protein [Burkholderia sp.]MDR0242907.1 hypothetical protein [Burkholderia sp.]
MSKKENVIQAAINDSLAVYCKDKNLKIFPPYANQQGDALRKYCGDLLGVLDDADLIALEIKELDIPKNKLVEFDQVQFDAALKFEKYCVPLAYAYNMHPYAQLAYYQTPKPKQWAEKTLNQIKRSVPSKLPGETPHSSIHQSLLDWLNSKHAAKGYELFGRINGAINHVHELRNGLLVFLYSTKEKTFSALSADEVTTIVKILKTTKPILSQSQIKKLEKILAAEADALKQYGIPNVTGGKILKP